MCQCVNAGERQVNLAWLNLCVNFSLRFIEGMKETMERTWSRWTLKRLHSMSVRTPSVSHLDCNSWQLTHCAPGHDAEWLSRSCTNQSTSPIIFLQSHSHITGNKYTQKNPSKRGHSLRAVSYNSSLSCASSFTRGNTFKVCVNPTRTDMTQLHMFYIIAGALLMTQSAAIIR